MSENFAKKLDDQPGLGLIFTVPALLNKLTAFSLKISLFFLQDYVNDRIKRIGGLTVFNLFIKKEFEIMWRLLTEIKLSLQVRLI
jgi:hypothetical protein